MLIKVNKNKLVIN